MIEFPLDKLSDVANAAEHELAYWMELFGDSSSKAARLALGDVAVILNAAIETGLVQLVVDEEAALDEWEEALDTRLGGVRADPAPPSGISDAPVDLPEKPAHPLDAATAATLGPEHTVVTPLRPIGRDRLPDPDVAREKLAVALANGQAESLNVRLLTQPRSIAKVDADEEEEIRPMWKRRADEQRKAGGATRGAAAPGRKLPTKAQQPAMSKFGTALPTLDEVIAEVRRQAMGGTMPTQAAFDAAKPAGWATATAHMTRLDITWVQLAKAADLKPSRRQ